MLFTAAGAFVIIRNLNCVGREKFADRETDVAENCTGIFVTVAVTAAARAVLFRQTVVIDGNQKLRVTLQTDDRELTQRYIDASGVITAGKISVKATADERGNFTQIAITVALAAMIHNTGIQHDGINGFHNSMGNVAASQHLQIRFFGSEC